MGEEDWWLRYSAAECEMQEISQKNTYYAARSRLELF